MTGPESRDEINDIFYMHLTVGAFFFVLALAYILSIITLWVVNSDNKGESVNAHFSSTLNPASKTSSR